MTDLYRGKPEMFFLSTVNALVVLETDQNVAPPPEQIPTPIEENDIFNPNTIAYWGQNNSYPQDIYEECLKNPIVIPTIEFKANILASQQWVIGQVSYENGERKFTPKNNPEIINWLNRINLANYRLQASLDLYFYYNFYPEIFVNEDYSKIVSIRTQKATNCRFSKQNQYGVIERCYVNTNWKNYRNGTGNTLVRPVIQRDYNPVVDLQLRKGKGYGQNFIYPISYPSVANSTYYTMAAWHTLKTSRVLEWANQIPEYKAQLMKHKIKAEWIVKVSQKYWQARYNDWDEKPELQEKRKKDFREEIETSLTGVSNAGKPIFLPAEFNDHAGTLATYIEFEKLNKSGEGGGEYIDDSQEACSLILFALQVPATLLGNTPGKGGMGAGSGSDTREHWNLYYEKVQIHQDLIFEPFNRLIFPYNGWEGWEIRTIKPVLQTLDKVNPDQRN